MVVNVSLTDGLAWLNFGDGRRGNALTRETRLALRETLEALADDSRVRAVVLEGVGDHFCAGQDLQAHQEALASEPDTVKGSTRREFAPIIELIAQMPKPVVACLRGIVAGAGLGLALASDLRIASNTTRFSTAFATIGLGADSGVSYLLPRLIGAGKATDLLLRPRVVEALEAFDLGLVHEVIDPVDARVREVAEELAAGPTLAYAAIKNTMQLGANNLQDALRVEADEQEVLAKTRDHLAAVESFINKTKMTYEGR